MYVCQRRNIILVNHFIYYQIVPLGTNQRSSIATTMQLVPLTLSSIPANAIFLCLVSQDGRIFFLSKAQTLVWSLENVGKTKFEWQDVHVSPLNVRTTAHGLPSLVNTPKQNCHLLLSQRTSKTTHNLFCYSKKWHEDAGSGLCHFPRWSMDGSL